MKQLIEIPFSVGDTVYVILDVWDWIDGKSVCYQRRYKGKVVCVHYSINKKNEVKSTLRITAFNSNGTIADTQDFKFSEVGITVFAVKEDSEKHMKQAEE